MIYLLIGLLLVKYRYEILDLVTPAREQEDDTWKPYAGLDYKPPEKPKLRRVK